jgi:predicted nucleotidyltransferase
VGASSTPRTALAKLVAATLDGSLDALCERFEVRLLSAFGSATRNGEAPPKDLDIGVSFRRENYGPPGPHASLESRLALWEALVDLTGFEQIDLVVLDVNNPVLRAEALLGVPLYECQADEYAEAQIAAVGEVRDLAPFRRRSLELMAQ